MNFVYDTTVHQSKWIGILATYRSPLTNCRSVNNLLLSRCVVSLVSIRGLMD